MSSKTTNKTITESCEMFADYGLPTQFVSDNKAQITAEEFANFM